ncbi:hypothetical protein B0H11DRAFT_1281445 [Mycena galericulata]|nr:hypothetical protein B0H11DRAFT_1281445 [Mycena galericulata]
MAQPLTWTSLRRDDTRDALRFLAQAAARAILRPINHGRYIHPPRLAPWTILLMASDDSLTPKLPPELERYIFELGALADRRGIPSLLRVAHRVHVWLEPLLYNALVLNYSQRRHLTPAFLAPRVQHLNLTGPMPPSQLRALLAACTRTTNRRVHPYHQPRALGAHPPAPAPVPPPASQRAPPHAPLRRHDPLLRRAPPR